MKVRDRLVVRAAPARTERLEELRLFLAAPHRIVRFGPLEVLHLQACVFEQLAHIGHRRAPFGRQPFALLAMDRESPVDRGPEPQVPEIETPDVKRAPMRSALPWTTIASPDQMGFRPRASGNFERAAGSQGELRGRAGREARGAQIDHREGPTKAPSQRNRHPDRPAAPPHSDAWAETERPRRWRR